MDSRYRFLVITSSDAGMYHYVDLVLAIQKQGHQVDILVTNDHPSCTWAYTRAGLRWHKCSQDLLNEADHDLALCHCPEMYTHVLQKRHIPICTLLAAQDPAIRGNSADAYAACDLLLVGGEHYARELRCAGTRTEIITTGLPRYDRLFSWPRQDCRIILFTDTDSHPTSPAERKALLEQLCTIAWQHPDYQVLIKCRHPRNNGYAAHFHAPHLGDILKEIHSPPANLHIIEETKASALSKRLPEIIPGWRPAADIPLHLSSLEILLACSSVLISYPSSCILPALAMDIPLLILDSMFNQEPPPGEPFGLKGLTNYYQKSNCVIPQHRLLDFLPQGLHCDPDFIKKELYRIDGQATARIIPILETLARELKTRGSFLPPLGLDINNWKTKLTAYFARHDKSDSLQRQILFMDHLCSRTLTIILSKLNFFSNYLSQDYTRPEMEDMFTPALQALLQALKQDLDTGHTSRTEPFYYLAHNMPGLVRKMWQVLGEKQRDFFPGAALWIWSWCAREMLRQQTISQSIFACWITAWWAEAPLWATLACLLVPQKVIPREITSPANRERCLHRAPAWTRTLLWTISLSWTTQRGHTPTRDFKDAFYQLDSKIDQLFFLKIWAEQESGPGALLCKHYITTCLQSQAFFPLPAFLNLVGHHPEIFFQLDPTTAQRQIREVLSKLQWEGPEQGMQLAELAYKLGSEDLAGQTIKRTLLLDPGHKKAKKFLLQRPALLKSIKENTSFVSRTAEKQALSACQEFIRQHPDKRTIIFGAGELGRQMAEICQKMQLPLLGFADSYLARIQKDFQGLPLYQPHQISALQAELVLIASISHAREIRAIVQRHLPRAMTFIPPGKRTDSTDSPLEKTIAAINELTKRNARSLLLCTRSINHNQVRFLMALKKKGWTIIISCPSTLVCGATPFDRLPPCFDLVFHPADLGEQLLLLSRVRPLLVHYLAYMFHLSEAALARMSFSGPFILECCDLTSTAFDYPSLSRLKGESLAKDEFWAEEFLLRTADGLVYQDSPESLHYLSERYQLTGIKSLHFQSYPMQDWITPPRLSKGPSNIEKGDSPRDPGLKDKTGQNLRKQKNSNGPWRVVYAGGIHSSLDRDSDGYFLTRSLLRLVPEVTSQGICFDIYNAYDRCGQGYDDFLLLSEKDPLFNYYPAIPNHELSRILPDYHWGWYVLDFSQTKVKKQFYQECFGSKFWAYVEAGLPILISPEHTYMANLVRTLDIGLVCSSVQLCRLKAMLAQTDRARLCKNLARTQHNYLMERQIIRLENFYQAVCSIPTKY